MGKSHPIVASAHSAAGEPGFNLAGGYSLMYLSIRLEKKLMLEFCPDRGEANGPYAVEFAEISTRFSSMVEKQIPIPIKYDLKNRRDRYLSGFLPKHRHSRFTTP